MPASRYRQHVTRSPPAHTRRPALRRRGRLRRQGPLSLTFISPVSPAPARTTRTVYLVTSQVALPRSRSLFLSLAPSVAHPPPPTDVVSVVVVVVVAVERRPVSRRSLSLPRQRWSATHVPGWFSPLTSSNYVSTLRWQLYHREQWRRKRGFLRNDRVTLEFFPTYY